MLTIKSGRFSAVQRITIACLLLHVMACVSFAAKEMTVREMYSYGLEAMQSGEYEDAIGFFYGFIDAVKDSENPDVIMRAQDVRYKASLILVKGLDRKDEATEILAAYVAQDFAFHKRTALKMLAACYFEMDMYEECVATVKAAIEYDKTPVVAEKAPQGKKKSKDEEDEDDIAADEEPEVPYTQDELVGLYFSMAESYFKLEEMENCIEAYAYVSDNTKNEQRKGYAIMQTINALVKVEKFDRILAWIPELYKTSARYDIRVNMALFSAASALVDAEQYDSALPLYRMILPRDELVAYQQKRVRQLRIGAGLPPEMGQTMTEDEQILFGVQETPEDSEELAALAAAEDEKKPKELLELETLLEALQQMAPYENFINFQMASVYNKVDRFWEGVKFFDMVSASDPTSELGQRAIYESVAILGNDLKNREEAEKRAIPYLDNNNSGIYPRIVTYILTGIYQSQADWKALGGLRKYIDGFEREYDVQLIKYDTELYFMQGVANLMVQAYTNAVNTFGYVVDEFPDTDQAARSLYWQGFSYLCIEDNQSAFDCFEKYSRNYSNGDQLDEAYYQGGIALFGMDQISNAYERFTYVIDGFGTNSIVYPDALNMRGDIEGAIGGDSLDAAVADYQESLRAATKVSQATYATFKLCDIYKADEATLGPKSPELIKKTVNLYLAEWGGDGADISKALLWLGRIQVQEKKYVEATTSYLDAIIDYGGDLDQEGVDLMIPELVKMSKSYLNEEQRDAVKNRLSNTMEITDNMTLKLRLRVALATFDDTVLELGKQLSTELPDFEHASPPVLAAICEAAYSAQDYSRSGELLSVFKINFDDSPYKRSAYKLHATGQFKDGDYDGAMDTIAETQAEFGTERDVVWAQLMKAKILLNQAVMFSSAQPLTPDVLAEASKKQLMVEQGRIPDLEVKLEEAYDNSDTQAVVRLEAELDKLDEKIVGLQQAMRGHSAEKDARALLARCKLFDAREEYTNMTGVPAWRGAPIAEAIYMLGQVEEQAGRFLMAHAYYQRAYFQYAGYADGYWAAEGYLGSARCLDLAAKEKSGQEQEMLENNVRKTYRAMLYDPIVGKLPQADVAREFLGPADVAQIEAFIESGSKTNIEVSVEAPTSVAESSTNNATADVAEEEDAP